VTSKKIDNNHIIIHNFDLHNNNIMKNDDTTAAAKFEDLEDDTVSEALSHFNLAELDIIRQASKSLGKVCNG